MEAQRSLDYTENFRVGGQEREKQRGRKKGEQRKGGRTYIRRLKNPQKVGNHGLSLFKQNKVSSLVSSIAAVTGFAFCFSQSYDKYCRTISLLCHSENTEATPLSLRSVFAERSNPTSAWAAADTRQLVPLGKHALSLLWLLLLLFQHWELNLGPHAQQPRLYR